MESRRPSSGAARGEVGAGIEHLGGGQVGQQQTRSFTGPSVAAGWRLGVGSYIKGETEIERLSTPEDAGLEGKAQVAMNERQWSGKLQTLAVEDVEKHGGATQADRKGSSATEHCRGKGASHARADWPSARQCAK